MAKFSTSVDLLVDLMDVPDLAPQGDKLDRILVRLGQLFIKPFIKYKHEEQSVKAWLEFCWSTDERPIDRFRLTRCALVPGYYKIGGAIPIQGWSKRSLKKGQIVFVRLDERWQRVDVELHSTEDVFQLTMDEWAAFMQNCEHLPWTKPTTAT